MKEEIAAVLKRAVETVARERGLAFDPAAPVQVETAREERFGDFASNVAMELASRNRGAAKPREIGDAVAAAVPADDPLIERVDVAGPGFLNFTVRRSRWLLALAEVLARGEAYGRSGFGGGRRVQVEFVSANPTGPLHLGHGRGAAVGDILARVLAATGHEVKTEFYINDAGRQVEMLARSVLARYREEHGRAAGFPEEGYRGAYVYDLAREVTARRGAELLDAPEDESLAYLSDFAPALVLEWIRRDLADFGVAFDRWFSERSLYADGVWEEAVRDLDARGFIDRREGALWFASTRFGDDKDRVVVKADGTRTYLASDILYHRDKFARGFERLVNVWGADHHGYVPRMKAVVQALGHPPESLAVRLVQLVTLTRKGKAVPMGKRQGEFTTLAEVVREVGRDAARFFFLMRRCESHLEFDLDLARERTADNPVFYVQYAHARIESIFRTRRERGLEPGADAAAGLEPLELPGEMALIRKVTAYPDVLLTAARTYEPHHLAQYLVSLAGTFHSYYNKVRVITDDEALSRARLGLVSAVQIVIRNALGVMGIDAPRQM